MACVSGTGKPLGSSTAFTRTCGSLSDGWEGRTIKAHRAAIRTYLGVHETTLADEEALVDWLCKEIVVIIWIIFR